MFDKFEKEQGGRIVSYHLKRNPNYFKQPVYITDFVIKFFNNSSSAFEALLKSKINLIKELTPSQYNMIKNKISVSVKSLKLPTYYSIIINQTNKEIYDVRLAQALEYSINKQELVNKVFYKQAEPLNLPISQGFLGYLKEENKPNYNIEKAKALLAEMNFKDENGDGFLEKNQEPFELNFVVASIDHLLLVSDFVKQSFENVGIKVNLKRTPLVDFQNEYLLTGNFDLILSGVNYGIKPDLHFI
jgi:peptide/nickel transport system substrate-binding protein